MKRKPIAALFPEVKLTFFPIINAHEEQRNLPYDLGISLGHLSYNEKLLLAVIEKHRAELPVEQGHLIENILHMAAGAQIINGGSFNFHVRRLMDEEPKLLQETKDCYEVLMRSGILKEVQAGVGKKRFENAIIRDVQELDAYMESKPGWKKVKNGEFWERDISTGFERRKIIRVSRGHEKESGEFVREEINLLKRKEESRQHYFSNNVMKLAMMP